MKRIIKLLSVFLCVLTVLSVLALPTVIALNAEDGRAVTFGITADKDEYTSDEEITLTVSIENKNVFPIRNLEVREILSNDIELQADLSALKWDMLEAEGKISANCKVSMAQKSLLGDYLVPIAVGAVLLIALILMIVLIAIRKRGGSAMAVILCLALILPMIPALPIQAAQASKMIADDYTTEATATVEIDGEKADVTAILAYSIIEDDLAEEFTVSFDTDGGTAISPVTVEAGELVPVPDAPEKEGYLFAGWYADKEKKHAFMFDEVTVSEDITLYADWFEGDAEDLFAAFVASQIMIGYQQGDNRDHVTRDVLLPTALEGIDGVAVFWSTSDDDLITDDGEVTRPEDEDGAVTLTVTVEYGNAVYSIDHVLTVIHENDRDPDEINDNSVIDIENLNPEGDITISYNDEKSQVVSIEGIYSDFAIENADDALDAIQGIHTIVGLDNPYTELELVVITGDEYGAEYTFAQVYNGYDVYARRITVSADADGITDSLGSGLYPTDKLEDIDTDTDISEDEAEDLAKETIGGDDIVAEYSELVYYTLDSYEDSPEFAYAVSVYGVTDSGDYTEAVVFIDCNTGDVINVAIYSTGASADTGSGTNELGEEVTFPVAFTMTDWYFFYMQDLERNIQLYDQKCYIDFRIGSELNWWTDATAISAYTNVITTYDWYKANLGRNSLDGNGMTIKVTVHNDKYSNNAFWSGTYNTINFCDNSSDSTLSTTTAAALDVVAHEYTHGVVDYMTGWALPYQNATGAIDEGYADIFACLVDGNWTIGEDWKVLRNASAPASCGDPDKLSSPYYIDYTVDSTDNGGVHTNASLVYYPAYLMYSYGMPRDVLAKVWYKSLSMGYDATSDFFTVRRNVLKAADKLGLSEEYVLIIKKAFDTVEIYGPRGTIEGTVTDVDGNPIADAELTFEHNGVVIRTVSSDSDGKYSVLMDAQDYKVTVSADDYVTLVSNAEIFENETTLMNFTLVKEGTGYIDLTVVSATSALTLSGATIKVREGFNMFSGDIVATYTSDSDGKCTEELAAGYYTFEISLEGYTTGYFNVLIENDTTSQGTASLSPIMTSTTYRVVLTWGSSPRDLDSHLYGEASDGSEYHVFYSDKHAFNLEDEEIANLDVDDTTSYGPETTTFIVETSGRYEFNVYRYSSSGSLADSGATVEVYNGTNLIAKFYVDSTESDSYRTWHVFVIENGIFKTVNTMS